MTGKHDSTLPDAPRKGRGKVNVAGKMSEASDQKVGKVSGKPALGKNIKETPEDDLKDEIAKRMGDSSKSHSEDDR